MRKHFRKLRNSLSPAEQKHAALALKKVILRSGLLLRHKHIALYLANDGEINPRYLLDFLLAHRFICYLPVLHPLRQGHLQFCRITSSTRYRPNRYGIAEPHALPRHLLPPQLLSLVLLPLVAFDIRGNRMGMGGGYYDRSFAFKRLNPKSRPRLVGLAHECQRATTLKTESWDLPLEGIITDKKLYHCH